MANSTIIEVDEERASLLDIVKLAVLTKNASKTGMLSAGVIQHAIEKAYLQKMQSILSSIAVLLDEELGNNFFHLSIELGKLPKYRKKVSKKDNSVLLLALDSFLAKLSKTIESQKKSTRINKLFNVKQASRKLHAITNVVNMEAEQNVDGLNTT